MDFFRVGVHIRYKRSGVQNAETFTGMGERMILPFLTCSLRSIAVSGFNAKPSWECPRVVLRQDHANNATPATRKNMQKRDSAFAFRVDAAKANWRRRP
jgi:hypothetical protein